MRPRRGGHTGGHPYLGGGRGAISRRHRPGVLEMGGAAGRGEGTGCLHPPSNSNPPPPRAPRGAGDGDPSPLGKHP